MGTKSTSRTHSETDDFATPSSAAAQRVHKLPATPTTVAYCYYWSQATPVLTIASGDFVDIETMLTNSPAGLERMGVRAEDIPQNLRDIVAQVANVVVYLVQGECGGLAYPSNWPVK